jgi:hypothetical protein
MCVKRLICPFTRRYPLSIHSPAFKIPIEETMPKGNDTCLGSLIT